MKAYLQLLRLPNFVAAAADVLAGAWIAVSSAGIYLVSGSLWLLVLASCLLYAAGVVLNEMMDAPYDIRICPDRPITSGKIGRKTAAVLVLLLFLGGLVSAGFAGWASLLIALLLVAAIVVYDGWAKRLHGPGSIVMGLCRALNLCLGLSIAPGFLPGYALLAVFPFAHSVAVTSLSRGENTGLHRRHVFLLALAPCLITISLLVMVFIIVRESIFLVPVFYSALYAAVAAFAFLPAVHYPEPSVIKRGVKYGLLSIVLLDAAMVSIFCPWIFAAIVVSLAVVSWLLSCGFPMT